MKAMVTSDKPPELWLSVMAKPPGAAGVAALSRTARGGKLAGVAEGESLGFREVRLLGHRPAT